ncbi:MAG TPA: SUMF1/EgtB/PvdO family nonheme iron enzyme [Thermodesulfobacteriota bacterium]|nr:SUMF1/EgtB/PvdO family nonheme iron enzyme [Thermodesulfobacteriota bacterium]
MHKPFPISAVAGCLFFLSLVTLLAVTGCKSATSPPAAPEGMVLVPKGEFVMGSDRVDREAKAMQYGSTKPWYANENPARKVFLDDFHIDRTEVTNREYKEFVDAAGHRPPPHWPGPTYPERLADHPVVAVTWSDAAEYCEWKGKRLPTEAQWEKAARGAEGRIFPWGDEFDNTKVNTLGEHAGTTPVGTFPGGASPYGALDMAGNAQEWTADWYKQYPGNKYNDEDYGEKFRVIRGGGWGGMGHYTLSVYVTSPFRGIARPDGYYDDVGIRCVK